MPVRDNISFLLCWISSTYPYPWLLFSPFSPPFPLPNTSSKFQSLMLQPYLEQPEAQQQQLQPQQAAVELVNDGRLHGSSIENPESGLISNHASINHSETAYHVLSIKTMAVLPSALITVLDNILAFVGRGDHPQYPRNKVMIWDDHQNRCISEFCFRSEVPASGFGGTALWEGNVLATASTKGTLIRIFNTLEGTLLQEVRRGLDRAEIYSVSFSPTAQWLAVSSDKGTVHVFSLKVNLGNLSTNKSNCSSNSRIPVAASSSFSFIRGVLPKYFSSEWSVAQFRLPDVSQYIFTFGNEKNTLIILGWGGSFFRCKFDPASGKEMTQLEYHNFLKPEEPCNGKHGLHLCRKKDTMASQLACPSL